MVMLSARELATEDELETGPFYEAPGQSGRACPEKAQAASFCTTPKMCPPVPDLMCFRSAGGVPFEYVNAVRRDPSTKLVEVTRRTAPSEQRYTPAVRDALTK